MKRIQRWLISAAIGLTAQTSCAGPSSALNVEPEQRLIESASTPADHEALATYFQAEADELRMMALAHRSMGDSYRRSKMRKAEEQKEHCERIAGLEERISREYERLSKLHAAEVDR